MSTANAKSKSGKKVTRSLGDRIVDVIIYVVLGLIALSTVLPFLYVLAGSFATDKELTEKAFFIIPETWSLNAYKYAINTANILRGLRNSVFLTIMGTVMCMIFSLLFAYPLSKKPKKKNYTQSRCRCHPPALSHIFPSMDNISPFFYLTRFFLLHYFFPVWLLFPIFPS